VQRCHTDVTVAVGATERTAEGANTVADPQTEASTDMHAAYEEYLGTLNTARNLRDEAPYAGEHLTGLMDAIADDDNLEPPKLGALSTMLKRAGAYRAARRRLMTAIDDYHVGYDLLDLNTAQPADREEHAGHLDGLIAQDEHAAADAQIAADFADPDDGDRSDPDFDAKMRADAALAALGIDAIVIDPAPDDDQLVLVGGQLVPLNSIPTAQPDPTPEYRAPEGSNDTKVQWVRLALLPTDLDAEPSPELKRSMAANGLVHAIRLEQLPDGSLRVVAGRRRILAARDLKWEAIRAEISQAGTQDGDAAWADKAALAENAVRSDNPIDEYKTITRLMAGGMTEKDIYQQTGMPIMTIRRRLVLGDLVPELWERVEKGEMGVWAAEYAAKMPAGLQQKIAADPGKVTGKKIEKLRRERQAAAVDALFDDANEDSILASDPEKLPWETVAANALKELETTLAGYGDDAAGFVGRLLKLRSSLAQ
jgi:hypothetical protein